MKKTSTKLFLAAAALGLAAASTIGSTYAWFTINGNATVSGVSMQVTSGSGISVKKHADAKYGVALDLAADNAGKKWAPCTPSNLAAGTFQDVDVAATIASSNTTGKYILKNIDSKTNYVYEVGLDVRVTEGYDFTIQAKNVTCSGSSTYKADEVIRVAVVTYDDGTDAGTASATAYRLKARSAETDLATAAFNSAYGCTVDHAASDATSALLTSAVKIEPKALASEGYVVEYIKLVVWYEGTDYACSNAIFEQTVSFDLELTPVQHAGA